MGKFPGSQGEEGNKNLMIFLWNMGPTDRQLHPSNFSFSCSNFHELNSFQVVFCTGLLVERSFLYFLPFMFCFAVSFTRVCRKKEWDGGQRIITLTLPCSRIANHKNYSSFHPWQASTARHSLPYHTHTPSCSLRRMDFSWKWIMHQLAWI